MTCSAAARARLEADARLGLLREVQSASSYESRYQLTLKDMDCGGLPKSTRRTLELATVLAEEPKPAGGGSRMLPTVGHL